MPIVITPEYPYFLDKYSQKNIDIYKQNNSKLHTVSIDGHYWIEKDGKVIDTTLQDHKRFEICNAVLYYKPAPEITQKLAIEYMYKINESIYNVKRDTEMFKKLVYIRDYKFTKCLFNILKLLNENGGKIVFGSLGFKYPNGINQHTTFTDSRLPKNAVIWVFGFGKYNIFKDFFQKYDKKIEEFITIEN